MKRSLALWLTLIWASSTAAFADDPNAMLLEPVQAQEAATPEGTGWRSVSSDAARFLSFQHAYRIAFQEKTRRFLGGPFFSDYASSVKGLGGWKDGDNIATNYLLHPLQGAASGFVFLQHNPASGGTEFGKSGTYWRSRLKALGFAVIYGLQFELGPISEAAIGNVGKKTGTMGFVDLVITPVGGFGWILAEDVLDRFVVRKLEQKWKRKGLIRFVRVALNPARSFANVMRLKLPWYRPGRELNKLFPAEPAPEEPPAQFFPGDLHSDEDSLNFFEAANIVLFVPA
jgi:hypothetical protein